MVAFLVFIMATLEFLAEKSVGRKNVHLAITFTKIRLDICVWLCTLMSRVR